MNSTCAPKSHPAGSGQSSKKRHRSLACLAATSLVFVAATTHAQDKPEKTKEECIAANESAQTMRASGKLREAKAQLLVCIDKTCPSVIRDDCAERLDALDRAIPTIVFTAKGTAGADLTNVTVTMDGAKIAERLDASAIAVDPGEHTFEFSSEGYPPITKKILVREGAKGHQELIDFAPGSGGPGPGGGPAPGADASSGDTQRIASYVLGGAGILGLGLGTFFGLKASSTYKDAESHCPSGPSSCTQDGITGGEDAHTQAAISTVSFVAGGLLLGGALVLYFTAPSSPSSTTKTARAPRGFIGLSPTAGPGAAGLRLGGTF